MRTKICTFGILLIAICFIVECQPKENDLRLIRISKNDERWVTPKELIHLSTNGIKFFDITDHPNLAPKEDMWEPTIPGCCENKPFVFNLFRSLSKDNMFSTIQNLSSFWTRYYQSTTGAEASEWLFNQCQSYINDYNLNGIVTVEYFPHTWLQPSVIARIPGTDLADEIVILGAHLDSIIQNQSEEPPYPRSPGANDDASGCSNVLEVFRVLLENNYKGRRTIEFHFYSAEEVGLRGSQDIAVNYQSNDIHVFGMLQLDMTAFPDMKQPLLRMINDYTNVNLMNFLKDVATTYSSLTWFNSECGYPCSDHASWNETGFYSCRVRENGAYDDIHTITDVISNVWIPYSLEFAKIALGYLVELSTNVASATPLHHFPSLQFGQQTDNYRAV